MCRGPALPACGPFAMVPIGSMPRRLGQVHRSQLRTRRCRHHLELGLRGQGARHRPATSRHFARHRGRRAGRRRDGHDRRDPAARSRIDVTIYSDRTPADTTSFKAGGQWAVSVVEFQGKEQELGDIIRTAYTTFKNSIGQGFGVSERPNYTATRSHNLDVVLSWRPASFRRQSTFARLPFEGHTKPGFEYQTLLIEPPIFLARLEADLNAAGSLSCRGDLSASPTCSRR